MPGCPPSSGSTQCLSRLRCGGQGERPGTGMNIVNLSSLSIEAAQAFFSKLHFTKKEEEISRVVIKEITNRLQFMLNVGIEYLTLDRKANTLSGGEAQR